VLAENLISEILPVLKPSDTGQQALNLMDVFRVSHLPVVRDKEYVGLISDQFIYDRNLAEESIENHLSQLHTPHVLHRQHIIEAASLMYKMNISVIPVTDEEHTYIGSITIYDISRQFAQLVSLQEPGGIIILQTVPNNYSASQISQIVEGNDSRILSLFVSRIAGSDNLEVTIKLDKVDLASVIQTFTRYNYNITSVFMDESILDDMYEDRLEQFLRYMKV
jgi:acetoin utilization protein AcuB